MPLILILESKSQNGIQMFKSLKMVPFLLKLGMSTGRVGYG